MNFILKTIIKKVFQKYLNLEQQLNVESGLIKLPFGKINHEQINKKLAPFNIKISQSIYKNLTISIPLTQIVSKPIKISIERFEVVIAKSSVRKKEASQKQQQPKPISEDRLQIEEQVSKYSKNTTQKKQEFNSGYIKNMVNRLLYNMQILFEKVIIKMQPQQHPQQHPNDLSSYLSTVQFEISQLHLRNSLVLLEANIIKKIFNFQQILIRHKFAELILKDFNICLDYNNHKLNIIAILGSVAFNLKQIPTKELQKLLTKPKPKRPSNTQIKDSPSKQNRQKAPFEEKPKPKTHHHPKPKPIQYNIYIKITQASIQVQNLFSLKGQALELKFKTSHESIDKGNKEQKLIQAEIMFKTLLLVQHNSVEPYEEKDFVILRYLPSNMQVKTFSQYEDNILKSCMLKISHNTFLNNVKKFTFLKNQDQVMSSASLQNRLQLSLQSIRHQTSAHLTSLDVMVDLQIMKKVIQKVLKHPDIKQLFTLIQSNKSQNQQNLQSNTNQNQSINSALKQVPQKQKEKHEINFVVYRIMVNVRLFNDLSVKLYGSFRGNHTRNLSIQQTTSMGQCSVCKHPKHAHASQYVHPHLGKHTHKKRHSNKQLHKKPSQNQKPQKQISLQKAPKPQKTNGTKILINQKEISQYLERSRIQLIQMCIQLNEHKVVDVGTFEVLINRSHYPSLTEVILSGSTINSQLSLKLITDIISLVPIIQNEIQQIKDTLIAFRGKNQQHFEPGSPKLLISQDKKTQHIKCHSKKPKISIYLKLNSLNLQLGSLAKNSPQFSQSRLSASHSFIQILLIQISSISLGLKLPKPFKLTFSTMLFANSPHTLHRNPVFKRQLEVKVSYSVAKQLSIAFSNDFEIDLDQNTIQVITRYFSQLSKLTSKPSSPIKNNSDAQPIAPKQSSNDSCFVTFYNTLSYPILLTQNNQYQASQSSLDLTQFQESNLSQYTSQNYSISISEKSTSQIFFLNEYEFTITLLEKKSLPVSLQFVPGTISHSKNHQFDKEYFYQHQTILQFDEAQILENKFVVQFLLSSFGKIQKIILKYNVNIMAFNTPFVIKNQNTNSFAFSIMSSNQQKFNEQFILDFFRTQDYLSLNIFPEQSIKSYEYNPQFLLDLDEQSKNLTFRQSQNKTQYKLSGMLIRSPNSKPQNNIYSLFGIYSEQQKQSTAQPLKLFQYYLYQFKHLQTNYFIQMPFLIIKNSLACYVRLQVLDKKSQIVQNLRLSPLQTKPIYPNSFEENTSLIDFYNKQFTMKILLISQKKKTQNNQIDQSLETQLQQSIIYESQQHYFNTFFMVEHDFQTLITLRSNRKGQFDKKYLFLKEELMLKTKVLKLEPSCTIINKTNFNFGLKFKKSLHNTLPQVKSPRKSTQPQPLSPQKPTEQQIYQKFTLLPSQQQNNHIISPRNSQVFNLNQFKSQEMVEVLFQNLEETKVQVYEQNAKDGNILILSFNFAQNENKIKSQIEKQRKYCHLLFRLRIKNIQNHQFFVIQNFVTFKNLSFQNISFSILPQNTINKDDQVIFPLPPTTLKKFNNRLLILNSVAQIQMLYQELFSFGVDSKNKLLATKSKKSLSSSTNLDKSPEQVSYQNLYISIKDSQGKDQIVLFKDLLYSKSNLKQVSLGQKGTKLFSLLKDIKSGTIRLFFLQKLFNPELSYLLINNCSSKHFLVSRDNSEYTHHFVKPSTQKSKEQFEGEEESTQKIFVSPNSFSVLQNKQDFELFLCDENGKHLVKSTKQNLQKVDVQVQFHTTGNFQLVDLCDVIRNKNSQIISAIKQPSNMSASTSKVHQKQPQTSSILTVKTRLLSINLNLYNKLFLNFSISNLNFRLLEQNKIDCLVQDVSLKNTLTSEHILRIPEESYILVQAKSVGNDSNGYEFMLVKNLFVKCKNVIINLQKDLPYNIICLCNNLIPQGSQPKQLPQKGRQFMQNQSFKTFLSTLQANQSLQKLTAYLKQQLFLIKNIYLHEIHLSLSLDLENNNFSNVMVIPNYQLTNTFTKSKNLIKQLTQHYKTNILAKLPKLSFIFQNIKNPLNLFKAMRKVRNSLNEKIQFKPVLSFYHDQIPEQQLQFSLQRWNILHKKAFYHEKKNSESQYGQSQHQEQLLTFLFKNDLYYLVSNKHFIMLALNSKNIPKDSTEATFVHYESNSQQSIGNRLKQKWTKTYQNSMMRIIPLKDLQKIKLIRNKKFSQFSIHFKGSMIVNICDDYQKCAKLIDTINSLVM